MDAATTTPPVVAYTFGSIFSRTWMIYKKRIVVILKYMLMTMLPLQASWWAMSLSHAPLGVLVSVLALVYVLQFIATIGYLYLIAGHDENITIKQALRRSWNNALKIVWACIVAMLIGLGGYLLLFVPYIIWSLSFLFVVFVAMTENITGFQAFARARHLVKGVWWKTFLYFLVSFIPLMAIEIAVLPHMLKHMSANPSVFSPNSFGPTFFVWSLIISLVLSPLYGCYYFVVFEALRSRRPAPATEPKRTWYYIAFVLGILLIPLWIHAISTIPKSIPAAPTVPLSNATSTALL